MKKLYTLTIALVLATAGLSAQSVLFHDFEDATIGDEVGAIGWNDLMEAEIADDPLATGNNVLKFVPNDYNAAPYLEFTLEAGTTMADYNNFMFKGYFQQGDVGWKNNKVGVSQDIPTGAFDNDAYSGEDLGTFNRATGASTAWETVEVDITNSLTFSGTVYIVFGMSTRGTESENGVGPVTTWFADDVELIAANPTSTPSLNQNKLSLYTKDNAVVINNCLGKSIAIYSISGTQVFSQKATSSSITAPLPRGLYIVEMDGVASKVIVKKADKKVVS